MKTKYIEYIKEYYEFSPQKKADYLIAAISTENKKMFDIAIEDLHNIIRTTPENIFVNIPDWRTNEYAITKAARIGNVYFVKELLNVGADVNVVADNLKNTTLIRAVQGQILEIVDLLLNAGAKINTQNKLGKTALMIAASMSLSLNDQNSPIIRRLLDATPDVYLKDNFGVNFIDMAKTKPWLDEILNDEYGYLVTSAKFGL